MSSKYALEFEKPLVEAELRMEELRAASQGDGPGRSDELARLEEKTRRLMAEIYSGLTPWQITQVARHPDRPYAMDYIKEVFDEFTELHGDRLFGDDHSIVGGLARIEGAPVVVIGQQKGRSTKEKIFRNFGMTNPEGYRKALRLMRLAERFSRPVITLIDTPGAYPGVGAEERGQAEAIATNLLEMSALRTPIISVVIGEGGSGGALALGVADHVMMMEFATYSVISPEGCAAILWKDGSMADAAASSLKMTSTDLMGLKLIDNVIKEPLGAAHRNLAEAAASLKTALLKATKELSTVPFDELVDKRYAKFRKMGAFKENARED